jgi:outer membrane protein assembly factor BamD
MLLRIALISCLTLILFSCSKNEEIVYEPSDRSDPYLLYEEGLEAFNKNNFFFANKKFTEAELNFEKPDLAAKSSIMACFSLYGINFYNEAEDQLKMFLQKYPADKHIMYAHYLLAIVYYEQISDEKKDLLPLLKASEKIEFFLKKFPNTDYAIDLKFKQDLILNQLAAKELYIARYYISIKKWIPAINRLKNIVTMYDKTVFIEEALHRLVEINYLLGLQNEANKYAKILGYNYSSSEWFQQSYKVLNKDYEIIKEKKVSKNKDNLLKKIIKMIK